MKTLKSVVIFLPFLFYSLFILPFSHWPDWKDKALGLLIAAFFIYLPTVGSFIAGDPLCLFFSGFLGVYIITFQSERWETVKRHWEKVAG